MMSKEDELLKYISGCNLTESHKSDLGMTFSDMKNGHYWCFELLGIKVMDLSNLIVFVPNCLNELVNDSTDMRAIFDACLISYGMNMEFHADTASIVTDFMSILSMSKRVYNFEEAESIVDFIMIVGKYVDMDYNQVVSGWRGYGFGLVISEVHLT